MANVMPPEVTVLASGSRIAIPTTVITVEFRVSLYITPFAIEVGRKTTKSLATLEAIHKQSSFFFFLYPRE